MNRLLLKGLPLVESALYKKRFMHVSRGNRLSQTASLLVTPGESSFHKAPPYMTRKRSIKDLVDLYVDGNRERNEQIL
jgi:hypothetical protein